MTTIFTLGAYCQARLNNAHRKRWLMLTLMGLLFLLLTKSRTSFGALLFVVCLLECVVLTTRRSLLIGLCLAWSLCAAAFLFSAAGVDLADQTVQAGNLGREDDAADLNGRLPLWAAVIPFARRELLLGYGFESFWTGKHIDYIQHLVHWPARDAHSLYVNMILGVGVTGLLLFLLMMVAALWSSARAFRRTRNPGYSFLIALILSMLTVGGLEETGSMTSLLSVLICCGISTLAFEVPQQRESMIHSHGDTRSKSWPQTRQESPLLQEVT